MSPEDEILQLLEEYFKNATQDEIKKDVDYINSLGTTGVTFDEYLNALNRVTSYSLLETGVCDDIAFADFFNKSISPIQMDELDKITLVETTKIPCNSNQLYSVTHSIRAGESNYAMAA